VCTAISFRNILLQNLCEDEPVTHSFIYMSNTCIGKVNEGRKLKKTT
jgi:hypothetical protein